MRAEGHSGLPATVRALVQVLQLSESAAVVVGELEGHVDAFRRDTAVWRDMEVQALAGLHYAGRETTTQSLTGAMEILCKVSEYVVGFNDGTGGQ